MRTLIANGTVVTTTDASREDVLIEDDRIAAVAATLDVAADRVIDASGRYVLPGGIDAHTHLDMPYGDITSADDFESGTVAAAFGGTTCVIDYATPSRGQRLRQALEAWIEKAERKAVVDYAFHMVVTELNCTVECEMDALVREGITSFKVFMAYPGRLMLGDDAILRVLERSRENGATVCLHAEDGVAIEALTRAALGAGHRSPRYHALTRPPSAEADATRRAIALAERARAPLYVVHVSVTSGLEAIRRARARGLPIYGETCPQYLFLSEDSYEAAERDAAKYVMSPPLRPAAMQRGLWDGLACGDLQVVATDHCPFTRAQKERDAIDFSKIPNGAPGIETRMPLVYDGGVRAGRLSLNRFVDVTSTSPARIFGLYPRKGVIAPGSDADIVIFDPEKRTTLSAATHHMRVDYNLYEGREVAGAAETVLSRGRVIVENGTFTGRPGAGRFVPRAPRQG